MPQVQRKRRRLGQSENGCARRRAERPDHVWSYDFIHDQTADGRGLKMLPVVDEFTRECLTIEVERSLTAEDVVSTLEYLFEVRGEPEYIRSDNGPEFIAEAVEELAGPAWVEDAVHRPGEPVGERLQRDVQQPAEGRAAGPRGVRDAEGGEGDRSRTIAWTTTTGGRTARWGIGPRRSSQRPSVKPGVASLPPADAVPIPDPALS